jgi:ketose-bisphosphate aldolase
VPLVPSIELIREAFLQGYAIPSFCTWNAESMKTVLDSAEELRAPVMIMNGWAEFPVIRPALHSLIAHGLIKRYSIPAALHLDHGQSMDEVRECIEAHYTSVMLDFSAKPFEENLQALQEVVRLARPHGITVEGELGAVGMVDNSVMEGNIESTLTDPDAAKSFVEETGVDMLAVSIGNAHGMYREHPRFDFGLLGRIHELVRVPLVLHGGSGTPDHDLKRAITSGIAKINVASELVQAVRVSLIEQWGQGKNLWIPLAEEHAYRSMAETVRRWIGKTGAAGRA